MNQQQYFETCSNAPSTNTMTSIPPVSIPTYKLGQQAKLAGQGMTVNKVTCGLQSIPYGTRDANINSIPAKAPPGKQFCKVEATFTNVGTVPTSPDGFANIVADSKQYAEDDDVSGNYGADAPGQPAVANLSPTVNPGDSIPFFAFYLLPQSVRPSLLQWPSATLDDPDPKVQFATE